MVEWLTLKLRPISASASSAHRPEVSRLLISQPLKDERIIMPKSRQMTAAEYEADFKRRMEEFRARSSKPKPKTEFTVEDDDLICAYRRAHPKDKAKLDALDHNKVLKKARRWFADVIWRRVAGACRYSAPEDGHSARLGYRFGLT
jgi:hypothetical protein